MHLTKYVQIINTVNDLHDNECQNIIPYETNYELMLFWKYKIIETKNEKYTLNYHTILVLIPLQR